MTIAQNIRDIQNQITNYSLLCNRDPNTVLLLAVSKTKPATAIVEAYQTGLRHFGENYCQEAITKQKTLGAFDITWHFIGPIQSNKTKLIAQHFSWVHSVDSVKIATRLNDQRPRDLPPLNICLQVNVSEETSKSGIHLAKLRELALAISQLPNLKLRGVMTIPAPEENFEKQCQPYKTLHKAVLALKQPELTTFSYGMTDDLKAAISEGATIVRIGTALFGKRL